MEMSDMKNIKNTLITLVLVASAVGLIAFVPGGDGFQKRKKTKVAEHITFQTNINGQGNALSLEFVKGPEHNHPLMAVWIEDMDGNYIQTLYVATSIAKGVFAYGDKSTGRWKAGEIQRPAALPYWAHKRNVMNDKGNYMPRPGFEVPDAYSGATPKANFTLETRTDKPMSGKFRVLMEINQSWDWNRYWTNNKFPDDREYKTSSQPAIVYAAEVTAGVPGEYPMQPIGRSHHAGADGKLYNDLETLTTALKIVESVKVVVKAGK
jgi:hypothetical protein